MIAPQVTRVVAILVVAAALLRWAPSDDPRDVLGRGAPHASVALDRALVELGPDTVEARAHAKAVADSAPRIRPVAAQWTRLFRDVELSLDK